MKNRLASFNIYRVMARSAFFLFVSLLTTETRNAQTHTINYGSLGQTLPPELWYNGKVVLENKDTISGLINYGIPDFVQVMRDGRSEMLPASKVLYFRISDRIARRSRIFYPMPFTKEGQPLTTLFFELISNGKITLLARERIETITYKQIPAKNYRVLRNQYYMLEQKSVKKISDRPEKLLRLTENKESEVRAYIKDNKLDLNRKYDVKQAIDYYNSFFDSY